MKASRGPARARQPPLDAGEREPGLRRKAQRAHPLGDERRGFALVKAGLRMARIVSPSSMMSSAWRSIASQTACFNSSLLLILHHP